MMNRYEESIIKRSWLFGLFFVPFIVALVINAGATNSYGQQLTVSGQVTDQDNNPLSGTSVVIEGTLTGISADFDGYYEIEAAPDAYLIFSFVGFETQRIRVESRTRIDVVMIESELYLDEIVYVGYGTSSRRNLTTAISRVESDRIEGIPINNVAEGLKGKLGGVRIFSLSGLPGTDPVIRIRGGSSINRSNEPLVLVDGLERSFADINPSDIAEVTVLKDAASTAIYGSRASNGVVLITTKRGQRGESPNITFESRMGFQERIQDRELMNAEEYVLFNRSKILPNHPDYDRMLNGNHQSFSGGNNESSIYTTRYLQPGESVPDGWISVTDPVDPSRTLIFQDTDYQSLMFQRAIWQSYDLVASGGTDGITYRASLGYADDQGIALSSGWNRLSARLNADIRIRPNLTFYSDFSYAHSNAEVFGNERNALGRGTYSRPGTQRPYWDDGTPTPGHNNTSPTPLYLDYIFESEHERRYLDLGGRLNWILFSNLHVNLDGRHHVFNRQLSQFERAHVFRGAREASFQTWERTRSQLDGNATYYFAARDHSISAMSGFSYNYTDFQTSLAVASGAATDKIFTLNAAPDPNNVTTNLTEEALLGFFSRITYDYRNKYLLSAVFRADGSSRFAKENRWGYFPGTSAAWVISEEPFMENINVLSFLKLRTSVGLTGNNSVGLYDAFGVYNLSQPYAGSAGIRATTMPNQDLKWESTRQMDIGLDFGLWDDRVVVAADYFDKLTSELLFTVPLPNTSGFNNIIQNVGQVKFHGFELEISTVNMKRSNFSWRSNFNIAYVQNEVVKLPDNGRVGNRIGGFVDANGNEFGGIAEGEPLGRFYGFKVKHIIETEEQADNAKFDELSTGWDPRDGRRITGRKKVGDYEWVDRDGDGRITEADRFLLGNEIPHTTGGLTNTFQYRNWTFNVALDWALGHSIHDRTYQWNFMGVFRGNFNLSRELFNAWENPGDNTKFAAFHPNDNQLSKNYDRDSDVFTTRADYLAVREISVSYDVTTQLVNRLGANKVTLYSSVNNLHYFTAVKGITPERGTASTRSQSPDTQGYPMVRRVTFGAKISF